MRRQLSNKAESIRERTRTVAETEPGGSVNVQHVQGSLNEFQHCIATYRGKISNNFNRFKMNW